MTSSRVANSKRNAIVSCMGQLLNFFIKFVLRTIFVYTLGKEYLGINGLFTNLLTFLSLAELGIGTAITCNLYKPLEENNKGEIKALMGFYKKAYLLIALFVGTIGISLTPFLQFFIKEMPENIPNIRLIYVLFVLNSAFSYLWSYKGTLISADQKDRVVTLNRYIFTIIGVVLQIIVLYIYHSYIGFLVIQLSITILQNISISIIADRLYPYLRYKTKDVLSAITKKQIYDNTSALMFHNVGNVIVFSTDNILLSKLFGLDIVGLYANYSLIISSIETMYRSLFSAIMGSVGNLKVSADKNHQEEVYYRVLFINYVIVSYCVSAFMIVVEPFIDVWVGEQYLLGYSIVIALGINCYIKGMRQSTIMFNSAYGLYIHYRYMPIPEVFINIIASIVLAKFLGPVGVFMGTIISSVLTCVWKEPSVLLQKGFDCGIRKFWRKYIKYFVVVSLINVIVFSIVSLIQPDNQIVEIALRLIICTIVYTTLNVLLFKKTDEYKYFVSLTKSFGK